MQYGGAIAVHYRTPLSLVNCTFINNTATIYHVRFQTNSTHYERGVLLQCLTAVRYQVLLRKTARSLIILLLISEEPFLLTPIPQYGTESFYSILIYSDCTFVNNGAKVTG